MGNLTSAMPRMNFTMWKTVALVLVLTELHNYCIVDAKDGNSDLTHTASDEWLTDVYGGVPLVAIEDPPSATMTSYLNNY